MKEKIWKENIFNFAELFLEVEKKKNQNVWDLMMMDFIKSQNLEFKYFDQSNVHLKKFENELNQNC